MLGKEIVSTVLAGSMPSEHLLSLFISKVSKLSLWSNDAS